MCNLFEVVTFTASLSDYAGPLVKLLDRDNKIPNKLFREHCVQSPAGFIKDLSLLGRDLSKVFIIDNTPMSYCFQPNNAIPILSWFSDTTDTELDKLIPVLKKIAKCQNVKDILKKIVKDGKVDYKCLSPSHAIFEKFKTTSVFNSEQPSEILFTKSLKASSNDEHQRTHIVVPKVLLKGAKPKWRIAIKTPAMSLFSRPVLMSSPLIMKEGSTFVTPRSPQCGNYLSFNSARKIKPKHIKLNSMNISSAKERREKRSSSLIGKKSSVVGKHRMVPRNLKIALEVSPMKKSVNEKSLTSTHSPKQFSANRYRMDAK